MQIVVGGGGLIFAGITIGHEAKAREAQNLLAFAERHRSLWGEIAQRPELHRILAEEADLSTNPITPTEIVFLNMVLVHFELGWRMATNMDRSDLKPLARDIQKLFVRPLIHAAWEGNKDCHNSRFVRFVTRAPSRQFLKINSLPCQA